jgi:hypothetical protein
MANALAVQRLVQRRERSVTAAAIVDSSAIGRELSEMMTALLMRVRTSKRPDVMPVLRTPAMAHYMSQQMLRAAIHVGVNSLVSASDFVRAVRCSLWAADVAMSSKQAVSTTATFGRVIAAIVPTLMSALADDAALARLFVAQFSTSALAQATSLVQLTRTPHGEVSDDIIRQVALVALGQMSVSLLSLDANSTFVSVFVPLLVALLEKEQPSSRLVDLLDHYVDVNTRAVCVHVHLTVLMCQAVVANMRTAYPDPSYALVSKALERRDASADATRRAIAPPLDALRVTLCAAAAFHANDWHLIHSIASEMKVRSSSCVRCDRVRC